MDCWLLLRLVTPAVVLLVAACQPEIGDECNVSTDCSAVGDRLCLTTQPDGYCSIFNCEPSKCPEESICVGFGNRPSRAPMCVDPQGGSRFQRTFCLARCDEDDDCRSGYKCIDLGVRNPWDAIIVENGASRGQVNGKVCWVPFQGVPVSSEVQDQVCTGTDAGFDAPPWTPIEAGPALDGGADADDAADDADAGAADDGAVDASDDGDAGTTDAPSGG